ncbi:MAG: S8 family peptidase [Clostridia bacterium]|nr:S8 family peptidase [Clostridia bacterium]
MNYQPELSINEFIRLPTTVDLIVLLTDNFRRYIEERPWIRIGAELDGGYAVLYVDTRDLDQIVEDFGGGTIAFFPRIMSPLDSRANAAAGISQVTDQPFLGYDGTGVLIGIIDTGIDLTLPAFRREDGGSKILSLWDQTAGDDAGDDDGDGNGGDGGDRPLFGRVYGADEINALAADGAAAPGFPGYDENGHGTFLASVAAGIEPGTYEGAAPGADIIAVKLRRARSFYVNSYLLSPDDPYLYESSDFMLGVDFVMREAGRLGRPAVVCVGLGSNFSAHDGNTLLEDYMSFLSERPGRAFACAAGNEANARHHTQGRIERTGNTGTVSLRVGRRGASFTVSLYSDAFEKMSVSVSSPTGEVLPRVPFRSGLSISTDFVLENSRIFLQYFRGSSNSIIIGFRDATEGVWDITVYGDSIVGGEYHAWLPVTGQVDESVEFLRPVPEYTVTYPATAMRVVTCGAYDDADGGLYVGSSWGPTRLPRISPDLAAPGVNIRGVYPFGYGTMTGTSAAAAVTAGAAALLMEWGIVGGALPQMSGDMIRSMLIGGARRENGMSYPNVRWGYGELDLYGAFEALRETNT